MTVTLERAAAGGETPAQPATPATSPTASAAGQERPRYAKRRLHHIFAADGKALVVAMDGARNGPAPGLHDPLKAVRLVVEGGADAILTTYGMARATADVLQGRGLIMALDSDDPIADYGVEHAIRFGADAVELKVFPGNPQETKLADLRRLAARCAEWGMPLLAEPIPVSFQDTAAHTIENVAKAARIGAECGADFLKVHYAPPQEQYAEQVIGSCYVPVLCLGGPAKADPLDALRACYEAMQAGARGIVFGRNIITNPRPDRMCAALAEIIHGGASVEAAAKHL
ncbi:MAG TPA: fructose-bisphosphate aldolase [Chloroflexota bacterium]|nr:fructose-bisphosphate aldolase [Chloroflexota bacterium]